MRYFCWNVFFLTIVAGLLSWTPLAGQQKPGEKAEVTELWDELAREHVRPGRIGSVEQNVVNYAGIGADERWEPLLKALEIAVEPTDRNGKLAFWINAYNILTIRVILSEYPVKSIKDAGGWFSSVWDVDAGVAAGEMRSLSEIEHEILRPMGEARIHAAIVCASVSCPPIRAEAFAAGKLDAQLDDQMRSWLANEKTGLDVEDEGQTLRVSSIFDWFGEDFEEETGSVRAFLVRYMPEEKRASLKADNRIRYLYYDWSLNDAARAEFPPG